jgi:hypothetical protein
VVAFGHEAPPGSGRVSERLAHLPAVLLCALAGVALGALTEPRAGRARVVAGIAASLLLAALAVSWSRRSAALVAEAGRDPDLRLASRVARLAHARLPPEGRLAVLAPPVSRSALQDYVRKVERAGGDAGRARELAGRLARFSRDADLVAAHLPRHPRTLVAQPADGADLVAVYDDAPDVDPRRLGRLVDRFEEGGRGVGVYATR